ncbi:MAG TPA: hypothetical protein PKC69_07875 [Chitinophagaceae bacterium]|nr:hypothetical protein [Chitinophagaceae bacterium]
MILLLYTAQTPGHGTLVSGLLLSGCLLVIAAALLKRGKHI